MSVQYFSVLAAAQKMVVYRFPQNPLREIISDQIFGPKWFHVKGFVKSDKLPSFEARQELKNIVKFFRLTVFSTMPPLSQCFSILEIIEMVGNINTKLVAKICCDVSIQAINFKYVVKPALEFWFNILFMSSIIILL